MMLLGFIGSAQSTRRRVLDSRETDRQAGKAVNQQAIAPARTSRQTPPDRVLIERNTKGKL
jgi:hypothetical protein